MNQDQRTVYPRRRFQELDSWVGAVDVPQPTPDVPPPPPPPVPPAPDTPWPTPPEVIEPTWPGQHEPVREPVVPKDGGEPGPVPPTVH